MNYTNRSSYDLHSFVIVLTQLGIIYSFIYLFILWMGTQNGLIVPFLESASFKKRKRNVMKRIKLFYKVSKKGNMLTL